MALTRLRETDPRLVPLYSLREAALYLDVAPTTLYRWAHPAHKAPLVTVIPGRNRPALPFVGFAEAFVIKAALNANVPRNRIRPGVEKIKRLAGGIEYALASQLVWTDGAEILWGVAGEDLEVARTNQKQFTKAVKSQLKLIKYGKDGFARCLSLPKYEPAFVTVNPSVAGGAPILRHGIGIRLEDILSRIAAGDTPENVAHSYRIPLKEVQKITG